MIQSRQFTLKFKHLVDALMLDEGNFLGRYLSVQGLYRPSNKVFRWSKRSSLKKFSTGQDVVDDGPDGVVRAPEEPRLRGQRPRRERGDRGGE